MSRVHLLLEWTNNVIKQKSLCVLRLLNNCSGIALGPDGDTCLLALRADKQRYKTKVAVRSVAISQRSHKK